MSNADDVAAVFDDRARCHWYDLCRNHADGYIEHPRFRDVYACRSCAHVAGKTLHPWEE